jgi:hypothetical protein
MGPQTFDNVGNETYPTTNRIQKGTGNEHLVDSCIIDDGTTVCVNANLRGSSVISATSLRSSAVGTFGFNTVNNGEFQIYATELDGIIMAGRGSSHDMVITNKSGSDVFRIPTGTINTTFLGNITTNGGIIGNNSNHLYLSSNSSNGEISFWGNQLNARLMTISGCGCVGIGTNTPSSTYGRLTVAGTGISIADDGNAKLQIGRFSSTACNAYIKMGNNACSLRFTNNTDLTDLVVIEKGGNVGVGSITPSQKLEVNGNTKINGTVIMNSPFVFRNKIQNGDMRIDQRYNGGTISNSEGTRPVDRFIIYNQIASNWSTQRSTVAPPGFANSLLATSTTGGSIGIGSYGGIRHLIEGLNTIDLAWGTASAKNITVSFWVRSSVTGTYGFAIRNGNANNYGYVSAYTISSANTWTYITLNIPGPTTGTWATDNTTSLNCIWDLGAGTLYSIAAGSWTSASEILGLTGGVKFFTNSSATYYLTGVQLEIGDVATPFEFLPYDVQLRQVQRYFQKWGNGVMFQAGQLGQVGGAYDFFKMIGGGVFGGGEMRDTPTISYDSAGTYWVGVGTAGSGTIGDAGTIPSSQYSSPQSLHILKTGIGRLGIGDFNTFSPTPVRGRWYVPNSDFVWVSADI